MFLETAKDLVSATANATHAAATATLSANANAPIKGIRCNYSYSAAPTAGNLQIKCGTTVVQDIDITAAGVGTVDLDGIVTTVNQALSAVLADGGVGIVGKVNLTGGIVTQ